MEKSRDLKQNRQHSAQAGRPHRHLLPSSERQDMRTRRQEEGLRSAMRGQGLDPELGRERSRVCTKGALREREEEGEAGAMSPALSQMPSDVRAL